MIQARQPRCSRRYNTGTNGAAAPKPARNAREAGLIQTV
jgi:hypothetical protein